MREQCAAWEDRTSPKSKGADFLPPSGWNRGALVANGDLNWAISFRRSSLLRILFFGSRSERKRVEVAGELAQIDVGLLGGFRRNRSTSQCAARFRR